MKRAVFFAVALLTAALVIVVGCQTEPSNNLAPTGITNLHPGRTTLDILLGGPPEGWDSVGVFHNRAMAYIDARLVSDWQKDWDLDSTLSYARCALLDFIKDSTAWDLDTARMIMDSIGQVQGTGEYVTQRLAELDSLGVVSPREVTYLTRLISFTYYGDTTAKVFADSLEVFKEDVLDIEWEENEGVCLTVTGVAVHSWDFQYVGWNFDPGEPVDNWDWRRTADWDIGGAYGGAAGGAVAAILTGGALWPAVPIGAGVGAVGASVTDVVMQVLGR
jgi:hypothetical protein